jgi:hypothetical protein
LPISHSVFAAFVIPLLGGVARAARDGVGCSQIRIISMEDEVKDILELTRTKMREAGEYSREAYREFIEESIEYYLEKGRLSDEDDLDAMREELMGMFEEIESEEVEDREIGEEDEEEREEKAEELDELAEEEDNDEA